MRILRDLLLFMSITASVSEETMVHACSSPLIIFGFQQTEMRSLMSSLENGFENNRKVLGQLMKSMDFTVTLMDTVDIQTTKLKGIHDAFRNQAMKIPLLWEKNEILLRYLVAPQKMLITYAISHYQVNDLQQTVCEDRDDSTDQPNRVSNDGGHETLESTRKGKDRKDNKVPPPSYENLEQILVHLCRDWSPQGKLIRQRLYTEGVILKVLENIPAVNSIDNDSAARNNEEYCYAEDETPCDRHNRTSPTTVISDDDLIQNSSETTANLKFMNGSEQATVLQRNGRRKIDSLCHHEEGSTNTSEELKDTKNQNRNKNQNKNKNRNQSKNKNNSVLRNSGGVRVLVPGAGLGRLASELAVLGYSVEANDCSGIMVAAMRTIIDDILPNMSTDTDTDTDNDAASGADKDTHSGTGKNTDSDVHSNTDSDTETHSNTVNKTDTNIHEAEKTIKGSDRDRINTPHITRNSTSPSFEFYPHISPKLADNWDFKSTLEAATFPSDDSVNVAIWLKKRRKHDILQNRVDSMPVSEEGDVKSTNETESEGNKVGCEIKGGRGECSAAVIGDGSPVPTPALLSTTVPLPDPTSTLVSSFVPLQTSTPVPSPTPVLTPETASLYPLGSLSIQMGEFTKVYSHIDQENQFDCVVTCFFIDTATDILEYLAVIAHVLREGGVWMNAGPLHYHMLSTIQYSYTQIIEVIKLCGFDVVSQDVVRTTSYSGEDTYSMKPEYYTVPLDVFRLTRKEDKWPLNGHKKNNNPISNPSKERKPSGRENHSQTQDKDEKIESDELNSIDEPWIRSDFVIKK